MKDAGVDLPEAVDGHNEGDPGGDLLDRVGVGDALPLPAPAAVVPRVYPALVNIDDSLLSLNKLQELECALLPLDLAPLGVSVNGNLYNLGVSQVELVPHHLADPMQRERNARGYLVAHLDI